MFSIGFGPLIGRYADRFGKYRLFVIGSLLSMATVALYTQLGLTPLWVVIAINVVMFAGITARMIPAQALMTAVPKPQDRGAFMSINASVQQISGGIASAVAGMIVVQSPSGVLERYDVLGYVVMAAMVIPILLMYYLNRMIQRHAAAHPAPAYTQAAPATVAAKAEAQ